MKASPRPAVSERETSREREARPLGSIPALGWLDIFWHTALEFPRDRILAVAAGISFYVLLALFPGLAALISLYGLVADPGTITHQIDNLSHVLPSGVAGIVGDQMKAVAARKPGLLGVSFFVGLGAALWSANAGMKALFDALNVVCGEAERRGIIKLNVTGLLFSVVTALFAGIALAVVVVLPVVLNFIGLGGSAGLLMNVGRWPVLFIATTLVLSIVYRYGPSRRAGKWRWMSLGSASAALLWIVVSLLFSWFVENFGTYDRTYGVLGAVVGFMTWIWLSATVFLIGAEFDAEIEKRIAETTRVAHTKSLDARGIVAADTIATVLE
jgi:membrane protein